ncbi:ATP synthase F1 subunit delta [Flavobacterium capsici]|uniref:ATP synthase subunit delta n=1 Tax=Flavobacterium capsici TaxID=3075618 RepID=A0AA96J3M8_9FLAO|nr:MULTISPECIES: ATP synthase F1 subunit delta [unclassified Flavobacterium]WNM20445.1 ATP synthase F1 subunit delta [Flavobacterium sp. PMR2A8]WNM23151.1 ATP synthase F1 subunit delta [Flavobacterium sp. PMTSA4]
MDMSRAAIRYAKAILEIADSNGNATKVNNDMKSIVETVSSNQELSDFLASPIIASDLKMNALSEVFSSVESESKSLFKLLQENKRFEILLPIAEQFNAQYDVLNGIEIAKVTTAIPMDAALEAQVLAKIGTISDKKITLQNTIDPSIIGGFILRIGDKQYNASVANRLQELRREFLN